jgi:hypothetical protein
MISWVKNEDAVLSHKIIWLELIVDKRNTDSGMSITAISRRTGRWQWANVNIDAVVPSGVWLRLDFPVRATVFTDFFRFNNDMTGTAGNDENNNAHDNFTFHVQFSFVTLG